MTQTLTRQAEISLRQRDDIVQLLHKNEVKTVQEAVDCIASLWNIKGHQEYALDAACQLGKIFH